MTRANRLVAFCALLVSAAACVDGPGGGSSGEYSPISLTAHMGVVGAPFAARIVGTPGWVTSIQYGCLSKLPPGLRFDQASGEIRGTPTEVGAWEVFVGVRDRFKGIHESLVDLDPDTVLSDHPKYIPVKYKPGQGAFYAGRFILTFTDHPLKPGEPPFADEEKNRKWQEVQKEGEWDHSRPMVGRIQYRPSDYMDPAATYSVPEYGVQVTLPPTYLWRTSDFQFKWSGETVAEAASKDGAVTAVLWHAKWGLTPEKWAEGSEKWNRENAWTQQYTQTRQEYLSSWLIREYEARMPANPNLFHFVILYALQGPDNMMLCMGTIDSHWGGRRDEIYKIIRSLQFTGPPPPAFTGIFSLQALVDFDSLDGVAVDPKTGAVSLFGHRARADHLAPIAYLDHLATAMECESPTFDLRWAPGSEGQVEDALAIPDDKLIDQLGSNYDSDGRLTALGAWWYGLGGAQAKAGMTRYQAIAAALRATGRKDEATAILTLEKEDEAIDQKKADVEQAYFELFCKLIGIDGAINANLQKFRAGQISEEQLLDAIYPLYTAGLARIFGQDAAAYQEQYFAFRRGGLGPEQARVRAAAQILSPENQKAWLEHIFFRPLFLNLGDVHVPPELCSRILSVAPRVTPTFEHLPPRSLLARVAYEADLFGKRLMVMPELKKDIPKYRTYFEWRRTIPQAPQDKEGHLWFSPDTFEIKESVDGNAVIFGLASVRINLRRKEAGRSVEDPVLRQYADELTGLYDDFARINPSLYELRECMKVVAVAGWLKKKGVQLKFPTEGRSTWNPPKEAPGIVEIVFSTRGGPVGLMLWALGGVDFDGRFAHGGLPGWTFEKSSAAPVPLPSGASTISLSEKDDRQIREIVKKTPQIEVPPPGTPIFGEAGWCARSNIGEKDRVRVICYMTLQGAGLERRADYPEIEAQRDRVLLLARRIEHCDKLTNAQSKNRVDQMAELEDLKKAAIKSLDEQLDELRWEGHDAILEWDDTRIEHWGGATGAEWRKSELVKFRQDLAKARGLLQETLDAVEEIREHKADKGKLLKVMEKVGELALELDKLFPQVKALEKAAETAESTLPFLKIGMIVLRMTNTVAEILDLHARGSEISDALGEAAKGEKGTDKDCKHRVDDFVREFQKLKGMVEGQPKTSTTAAGDKKPVPHSVGIVCHALTDDERAKFGIEGGAGVSVTGTRPGSPGERVFQKGDIILKAGANPIRTVQDLQTCVAKLEADESLDLLILRDGKRQTVRLTFGESRKY